MLVPVWLKLGCVLGGTGALILQTTLLLAEALLCHVAIGTDASLRRRSGLCYLPSAALPEAVAREGLTLVAEGQTNFTRRALHPEDRLGTHRAERCVAPAVC